MPSYLDKVLHAFKQHRHPPVLVGPNDMRWNGADAIPTENIEVLVSHPKMNPIAHSLIKTGDWTSYIPHSPPSPYQRQVASDPTREVWLKHVHGVLEGHGGELKYLHFYAEDLYRLPVTSCLQLEAPDIVTYHEAALEEEYERDPHDRFGPHTFAGLDAQSREEEEEYLNGAHEDLDDTSEDIDRGHLVLSREPARSPDNKIPIFVPSTAPHINALLYHLEDNLGVNHTYGRGPLDFLERYVRDLYLDRPPTKEWFLRRVEEGNRECMRLIIDQWHQLRDPLLWDEETGGELAGTSDEALAIPKEGERSKCDERCGWCVEKGKREGKK